MIGIFDIEEETLKRELLELEYQECQAGYNNRDTMTQDEFNKMLTLFGVLVGILIIFNSNFIFSHFLRFLNFILLISGILSLGSLLLDMESNMSSKKALRERSIEIEDKLTKNFANSEEKIMKIWKNVIPERQKYFEERTFKELTKKFATDWFIISGRILIIIWVILVIVVIINDPIPKKGVTILLF